MSRVTHGIRQPSPVPNGYSGTGTVPGGYLCLTGTYHGYPGVPIPVLHLTQNATRSPIAYSNTAPANARAGFLGFGTTNATLRMFTVTVPLGVASTSRRPLRDQLAPTIPSVTTTTAHVHTHDHTHVVHLTTHAESRDSSHCHSQNEVPYKEEDMLLSLHLSAYSSKYSHVQPAFYKSRIILGSPCSFRFEFF